MTQECETQWDLIDSRLEVKLALYNSYMHHIVEAWMETGRMSHDTQAIRECRSYHRPLKSETTVLLQLSPMYIVTFASTIEMTIPPDPILLCPYGPVLLLAGHGSFDSIGQRNFDTLYPVGGYVYGVRDSIGPLFCCAEIDEGLMVGSTLHIFSFRSTKSGQIKSSCVRIQPRLLTADISPARLAGSVRRLILG